MLTQSLKVGQSVVIADSVVVRVLSMDQGNVRLGIDAPKEISVNREEIQRQSEAGMPAPGGRSVLKTVLGLPD